VDNGYFLRLTVGQYLSELSRRSAVPGGGSAAALAAALGAGLNLMVLNFSIDRERDGGQAEKLTAAKERQQQSLESLSRLVDEDCKAFRGLMKALSEKKDAQQEYISAASVPMKVCRECHVSMHITEHLAVDSNRRLISDVGCAAQTLRGAFHSARFNVEINLKYIRDRSFVDNTRDILKSMEKDIELSVRNISAGIESLMNPKG